MKNAIRMATFLLAATAISFAGGVNVSSPAEGAVTNSPLHIVANAWPNNAAAPIAVTQIYVDGGLVYQSNGNAIDTFLNVGYGNHQVAVKFWDTAGTNYLAVRNVVGSGSGVFLTTPGANATIPGGNVEVKGSAFSPNNITAIQVYDNGNLIKQVGGATIDQWVQLAPGSHYLVVQAWDANGTTFLNPVNVTVPGAASSPSVPSQPQAQAPSSNTMAPQASIPGGAAAKYDIDQMGGWESCDKCAGPGGNGPVDPYSMSQGISTPSLDGKSATYWLGGKVPWGSALWWKQLGPNDGAKHFVYDLQFYVNNPSIAQGLEFDMNQSVGGQKYIFGTECDARTNGGWRVWDTANAHWVQTSASCSVRANAWNHLTWEAERVGNQTHFIAVTLNGYRQVVDKWFYSRSVGNARELNVAFQMDGDEHQDNYQVWLDKVTMFAW